MLSCPDLGVQEGLHRRPDATTCLFLLERGRVVKGESNGGMGAAADPVTPSALSQFHSISTLACGEKLASLRIHIVESNANTTLSLPDGRGVSATPYPHDVPFSTSSRPPPTLLHHLTIAWGVLQENLTFVFFLGYRAASATPEQPDSVCFACGDASSHGDGASRADISPQASDGHDASTDLSLTPQSTDIIKVGHIPAPRLLIAMYVGILLWYHLVLSGCFHREGLHQHYSPHSFPSQGSHFFPTHPASNDTPQITRVCRKRPGLEASTDLCDLQPAEQAAGRREKQKESPFRSGYADPSPRMMGERSAERTVTGLHTQAPSNAKALTHTHGYPTNETGGLSVGADGFTASIDGCLEGSEKRELETEPERDGAVGLLRR
ncbi:hypothetical protein NQZ68_004973 [Dissostichus eleginoides]|nr:hypothetical protein NQZ68_004973 [Dissostichus eleginoides]